MTYIKLLEAAVEDARDVCKYLDAGKVEEAKAHTEFYWAALDKIRDMDEAEKTQRKWVGLTDAEIDEGQKHSWVAQQAFESAVWWAEEKLKEKNT